MAVFGPKHVVTYHSTSGNIYIVIESLYRSITSLWTAEPLCFFLYYSLCRTDLVSVTYFPDKLCIAIYSHQSKHHEIHVRLTMKLETVNVSLAYGRVEMFVHLLLTSLLYAGEWLASRPDRFIP